MKTKIKSFFNELMKIGFFQRVFLVLAVIGAIIFGICYSILCICQCMLFLTLGILDILLTIPYFFYWLFTGKTLWFKLMYWLDNKFGVFNEMFQ